MTLFEVFQTPNDREWLQIRDQLRGKIKAAMREITTIQNHLMVGRVTNGKPLHIQLRDANERLAILQDDLVKHTAMRTKYETAGKSQLALF